MLPSSCLQVSARLAPTVCVCVCVTLGQRPGGCAARLPQLPLTSTTRLQEYIANKLQKQADRLGTEKAALLKEKSDLQRQAWPLIALCTFIACRVHGQIP